MKSPIYSPNTPKAIGPYSPAIKVGNLVFFSGQIPLDPVMGTIVSNDIQEQAQMVFTHLRSLAEAAGSDMSSIVKLTIYLIDLSHFPIINAVMQTFFQEPYPARATVQVSALPKGALIEVDAMMVKD